jgi:hypothetical protein
MDRSATQEIPCTSWNPKDRYGFHRNPQRVSILNLVNPVHTAHRISLGSILLLYLHLRLDLPNMQVSLCL